MYIFFSIWINNGSSYFRDLTLYSSGCQEPPAENHWSIGSYGRGYVYWLLVVTLCSLLEIYQIFGGTCCHHIHTVSSEMLCNLLSDFMVWSQKTAVFNLLGALKVSRISSAVRKSLEKFTSDSIFFKQAWVSHYQQCVCSLAPLPLCILQKLIWNISCCPLFSLFPLQILLWEVIIPLSSAQWHV